MKCFGAGFLPPDRLAIIFSLVILIQAALPFFASAAQPLTVDDFLKKAVGDSRDMKKIQIALKNDKNQTLLSEISYNPNFRVEYGNGHDYTYTLSQKVADLVTVSASKSDSAEDSGAAEGVTRYSLSADLRRLDRSDLRVARLTNNLDLLTFAVEREKFKLKVVRQFYDLVSLMEEYEVLVNSCERWNEMLNYSKSKYELGLANKIDYLNAEVNLGQAQNALLRQGQLIETAREQFFDLSGFDIRDASIYEIALKYDVKFEPMDSAEIASAVSGKTDGFIREDVEAEKVRLRIAGEKCSKAKKMAAPKLKLNVSRTQYENAATADDFRSTVSYELNLGPQDNRVNEWIEANNLELRRFALTDIENSVLIEQRDIVRKIKYLEEAYAIASKNLQQAEENFEFSKMSFQKGLISNIDLRDAQDKLTSAKRNAVSLAIQHRVNRYQFYYTMGKDL